MSIFAAEKPATVEVLNLERTDTALASMGIEFTEIGTDYLSARMPVDDRTRQPFGILHGGASVVLAETLASTAAFLTLSDPKALVVGLEINANHVSSVRTGWVSGKATPVHIGKTTQVWSIAISAESGQLVSICRMTAMIKRPA